MHLIGRKFFDQAPWGIAAKLIVRSKSQDSEQQESTHFYNLEHEQEVPNHVTNRTCRNEQGKACWAGQRSHLSSNHHFLFVDVLSCWRSVCVVFNTVLKTTMQLATHLHWPWSVAVQGGPLTFLKALAPTRLENVPLRLPCAILCWSPTRCITSESPALWDEPDQSSFHKRTVLWADQIKELWRPCTWPSPVSRQEVGSHRP